MPLGFEIVADVSARGEHVGVPPSLPAQCTGASAHARSSHAEDNHAVLFQGPGYVICVFRNDDTMPSVQAHLRF